MVWKGGRLAVILVAFVLASGGLSAGQSDESEGEATGQITLSRLVVEGNTALAERRIARFEGAHAGRRVTFEELKKIAADLQNVYHRRGYVTTRVIVPPQEPAEGVVKLRVVEGRYGSIAVEGAEHFSPDPNYLAYLPSEGEVLNRGRLDAAVRDINLHPDKDSRAVLSAGEEPGTTDVTLKVEEQRPWHVSVGLDNSGSENTPKHRGILQLQHDNLFDRSQSAVFQFTASPGNIHKVRQYALTYNIPLAPLGGPSGDSVTVYGGYSESDSDTVLGLIDLQGAGSVAGVRYSTRLPEVLSFRQRLGFGLEWQKVEHETQVGAFSNQEEVRKLPLVLSWSATRPDRHGLTGLSAGLRYQFGDLYYDFDTEDYEQVRPDTETDFWVAELGLVRRQRLPADWSFIFDARAQIPEDRLVPSEQYALGGYDTVRGYRNRLIVSDEALLIRSELRAPVLPRFLPEGVNEQIQPLAFVDTAWAENVSARGGELDKDEMLGVGVGLRTSFFDGALTGRVDAGWAMKDVESTGSDEEGDLTIHFGIVYRY